MANTPDTDALENQNLEELHAEDAAIDIDFDQAFQDVSAESSTDEANTNPSDAAPDIEAHASGESASSSQPADAAAISALEQQITTLKSQVEDRTSQYLRISADFENFRKRTGREKEDLEVQIKCNTISALLEVVDNFERARAQIKPQTDSEMTIHKSYQGVYKQLVDALKRLGVSPMRVEGQEFDPNLHEAVMRQPTDEHPEGTVIEELVRGYLVGERVLRHAMVKVATPLETDNPSDA
jgi:molecular chaperone GrpE